MSRRTPAARDLARQVLRRVRREAAYSNLALDAAFARAPALSGEERGLATELVYGVLRQQRRLDHVLARRASRPLARVNPDVLDVLRVGAYQLLFLDRVPRYAAVDQAVGSARSLWGPRVGGFVNAVLRGVERGMLDTDLPEAELDRLGVSGSLPGALCELLHEQMGLKALQAFASSSLERAPLTLRVNAVKTSVAALTQHLTGLGAEVVAGRWGRAAITMQGMTDPFRRSSYLDGSWTVQDEAAQLVGVLLDPQPGESVLDACAGVGGKSTQLAELMSRGAAGTRGAQGLLCADLSARKLELLDQHARRLGLVCSTLLADLTAPDALDGRRFDRVLVDAPCSGLGVLRRHPEIKWRWDAARLPDLVALQRQLLETAASALRPGGVLVYAVCTVTDQEGPEQLSWLCERFPRLRPDCQALPAELRGLVDNGVLRTWPQQHGTDGFYAVRLVCQEA